MVRSRLIALLGVGLVAVTTLSGCFFGSPFEKGDGSGTGTGRPGRGTIDMGKTGGLGSPRGDVTIGPGALGTEGSGDSSVGAH